MSAGWNTIESDAVSSVPEYYLGTLVPLLITLGCLHLPGRQPWG